MMYMHNNVLEIITSAIRGDKRIRVYAAVNARAVYRFDRMESGHGIRFNDLSYTYIVRV